MPKKRRYKSAEEILAIIDKKKSDKQKYLQTYHDLETERKIILDRLNKAQAKVSIHGDDEYRREFHHLNTCKLEIEKTLKSSSRCEARLEALKRTLAEFNTEPMPFIVEEPSVLEQTLVKK